MVRCGIFAVSIWNERFNLLMFTVLCAISIQDLKNYCKDRRLLLYMSRTLHLFGTDSSAAVVPIRRYCQLNKQYRVVVCLCFPTSNHNLQCSYSCLNLVVCLCFPTSNHNYSATDMGTGVVVCLCFPTSNHNSYLSLTSCSMVVCLCFPTSNHNVLDYARISRYVVCLCFPTSNHN